MAQQLIVEGSDAHFIANLCKKRNLPPPKGYSNPQQFQNEFVVAAGNYDKALIAFREALNRPDLNRIGLIVDADDRGGEARWQAIKQILQDKFSGTDLSSYNLYSDGIVITISPMLTTGIWVMPDNQNNGYLEHLVAELAPQQDDLWQHALSTIEALSVQRFCKFSPVRKQKALVHTWLAWQKEPGKPIGIGVQAGYFDANAPSADAFVNWIQNVFELS